MLNITEQITEKALELLAQHPQGLHTTELRSMIEASNHSFHPKTVNGTIWMLPEKYPDKVYKPERGLFKLKKYKSVDTE